MLATVSPNVGDREIIRVVTGDRMQPLPKVGSIAVEEYRRMYMTY